MSAKGTFAAWDLDVPGSQKLVALCLGQYANDQDLSWPSKHTVAKKTGMALSSVKRQVAALEAAGHIEAVGTMKTKSTGDGKLRETVVYRLNFTAEVPEKLPADDQSDDEIEDSTRSKTNPVQFEPSRGSGDGERPENTGGASGSSMNPVQFEPGSTQPTENPVQNEPGSFEGPTRSTVDPNPIINNPITTSTTSNDKSNSMRETIPANWSPAQETYQALSFHGVPAEFAYETLLEFRIYWKDRGGNKESWNSVFLKWCIGQWKRNGHQWRTDTPAAAMRGS